MKIKSILTAATLCLTLLASCNSGIEYNEVPESVYSNVNLGSGLAKIRVRELFNNKVWQVNHNDGKGQWLENYLAQTQLSQDYQDGKDYTNNTGSAITIMGKTLNPGETMYVKNTLEVVDDSNAPDGKKYIAHLFSPTKATYSTPNKGHLFMESAFANEAIKPVFVDEVEKGKSQYIVYPVRQDALVIEFILEDPYACRVERVNGAPALGTPGDYTVPQQYMVINTAFRPKGAPEYRRLYEIRVQLLDESK
ncbi:MAG: hypothetical protein K2G02_01075 [Phocaeicola sp.]|nr:hypothetical protein [Phocaeicola sp.]